MNTTDIRNIATTIAAGIAAAAAGYSLYAEIRSKAAREAHTKWMAEQDRRSRELWDRQQAEHEAFMARHGITTTQHR
jgi:O-methyltransferase involved in polyketide biosynthesis